MLANFLSGDFLFIQGVMNAKRFSIFSNKISVSQKIIVKVTLQQSTYENVQNIFNAYITFFPLVFLGYICDEMYFCVKLKSNSHFAIKLLQKSKSSVSGYLKNQFI